MTTTKETRAKDNARKKTTRAAVAGRTNLHVEDDDAIFKRLESRFRIVEKLATSVITGGSNGLILSGPPGVGKTFTVEAKIREVDPHGINVTSNKGYVRTTALFKGLHACRAPGQTLVLDDADTVLNDLNSLNILKAALDTSPIRTVTYGSDYTMFSDDGMRVPNQFDFAGSVIFVTNYDFDEMIAKKHKFAEHFKALMSRTHYVSLEMKNARDYLVRIRTVVNGGALRDLDITQEEEADVMGFIEKNYDKLRELSIRTAVKLGRLRHTSPQDWQEIAQLTMMQR